MTIGRQCVILVGGLGTRLGGLTRECPKPLLEIAGRPFLEHLMLNARRFGFDDFLLLAGYRAAQVDAFSHEMRVKLNCRVRVVTEPAPLGTGGALRHAAAYLAQSFLMMNGDSFFDFNLLDLAARPMPDGTLGRVALRKMPDARRFGTVELSDGYILAFRERPDQPGPGLINGGVYWIQRDLLAHITEENCSLERDVFPRLAAGRHLSGCAYDGFFLDMGVPDDYTWAQEGLMRILRRPAVFFDRDGVLNHDDGYTHRIEDFRWMEGAPEAIKMLNDCGWLVFVVTNQAGVARGYYDETAVKKLHFWMNDELRDNGAHIDDFRYCPHHIEGNVAGYSMACDCRKPAPGMLLDLLGCWPADVDRSVLIGDKQSDLDAAATAGLRAISFAGGNLRDVVASLLSGEMTP